MSWAGRFGVRPIVTSGYRSWHEQMQLRNDYLAGRSRWPANAPGDSAHNFGWAWDSVLPAPYRGNAAAESWWKAVREWAGFEVPSNDAIHAQVPNWRRFK